MERFCDGAQRDGICNPQAEYSGSLTGKDPILDQPRMQPYLAREKRPQREPRVRAAFLIAPAIVQGLEKLITLPKVGHYDFLSECAPNGLRVAATYCADGPGTQRADTHAAAIAAAIEFFEAKLR